MPLEEAAEVIGFHRNYVPLVCLIGGLMGLAAMFLMETWIAVFAYPLDIAGRPLFSWPAFVVPAYEWTILWAGLSAAFGMLALCGLPSLYHPLFNAPNFRNGASHRQVLPMPGSDRSEVFRGGIARFPRGASGRRRWWRWSIRAWRIPRQISRRAKPGRPGFWVGRGGHADAGLPDAARTCTTSPNSFPSGEPTFFADHRSVRPQVEHTVARGQLNEGTTSRPGS